MITALPVCDNSISATKIFYLMKNYKTNHFLYFVSNVDGLLNAINELISIIE